MSEQSKSSTNDTAATEPKDDSERNKGRKGASPEGASAPPRRDGARKTEHKGEEGQGQYGEGYDKTGEMIGEDYNYGGAGFSGSSSTARPSQPKGAEGSLPEDFNKPSPDADGRKPAKTSSNSEGNWGRKSDSGMVQMPPDSPTKK